VSFERFELVVSIAVVVWLVAAVIWLILAMIYVASDGRIV
jgi:hypothetical protein